MEPPSVHFLEFTPAVDPADHPDRFHVLWHLDTGKPPVPSSAADAQHWSGLAEGDLVVFPSLLSGAGEFEAVRFVGPTATHMTEDGSKEEVLLMSARDVVAGDSYPPRLSLFDLYSRDEADYNEFWKDPPVARRRRPPSGSPWRFSLGECVWIKTLEGGDLKAETKEEL